MPRRPRPGDPVGGDPRPVRAVGVGHRGQSSPPPSKIARSLAVATRRMLVEPATPKGMPAVTTMRSSSAGEAVLARDAGGADHRHLEAVDLGHDDAVQAPGERQPPGGAGERRQRDDRHARPLARGEERGGAGVAEAADRLDLGGLGHLARGDGDRVGDAGARGGALRLDHLAVDVVVLHRLGDVVHRRHRLRSGSRRRPIRPRA